MSKCFQDIFVDFFSCLNIPLILYEVQGLVNAGFFERLLTLNNQAPEGFGFWLMTNCFDDKELRPLFTTCPKLAEHWVWENL
jgi:hypothetical protein